MKAISSMDRFGFCGLVNVRNLAGATLLVSISAMFLMVTVPFTEAAAAGVGAFEDCTQISGRSLGRKYL